jgi:hypothetical protein
VPLLRAVPGALALPATPSTLILVPFILAVPFSALIFTGTNFFAPQLALQTPMELQDWGWTALDAWLPVVLPAVFCTLIGPVHGWPWGLGVSEDAAVVLCGLFAIACFVGRTWWNLAPRKKVKAKKGKVKSA